MPAPSWAPGSAALTAAEPRELDTLRALEHAGLRLGCQLRVAADAPDGAAIVAQVVGEVAGT